MAKKATKTVQTATVGQVKGVIQFEPCATPISTKSGIKSEDTRATYTLRDDSSKVKVFGVEDCAAHGAGKPTRLNSFDRYTGGKQGASRDYLELFKVQMLHLFSAHRGGDLISPTGIMIVPVSVYNNTDAIEALRGMLQGTHNIEDQDGCLLKVRVDEKRLLFLPESAAAIYHYAFDTAGKPRGGDYDVNGAVLSVSPGYLTTDSTLHVDLKYQREKAYTLNDIGMSNVIQPIYQYLTRDGVSFDLSDVDRSVRMLAGTDKGDKVIKLINGQTELIGVLYDNGIELLAQNIYGGLAALYKERISLMLLSGGTGLHVAQDLAPLVSYPVKLCPNPGVADVLGAYTRLYREAATKGTSVPLLYAIDAGNGVVKGCSSETMSGVVL